MYVLNKIHMCNIYIYTYIWHIYIYTHREIFFPLKWRHLLAPYVPCFKTMGPWHTFCMNFDEDLRPLLRNVRFVRQNRTVFKSTVFLGTSVLIQLMVGFGPTGQLFGELLGDNSSDLSATWLEPLTLVRLVTVLGTLCLSRLQLPGKHHQTMRLKGNGSAKCFWMGQDTWVLWLLSSRAASQSQWIRGVNVADLGLWVMFRPHNFDPDFTAALATISKICNLRAAQKAVRTLGDLFLFIFQSAEWFLLAISFWS